jgi:hypothetical protein|tara:strand:- start:8173 stop:8850 length:678 start_codon:yes stop_codon:yes gene_type:complete
MAITVGNKSTNTTTPGSNSFLTFNHTQDTGSDGLIVVAISMSTANNSTTVKYNGVAMTERLKYGSGQIGQRWGFWELAAPATGSNQVRIDFTGNVFNPVNTQVQSFTGAEAGGLVGNNDQASSPHSRTRASITAGSLMMVMSVSTSNIGGGTLKVDGVTISKNTLNNNRYQAVGTSTNALSAGSVVCIATGAANWNTLSNQTLEIKVKSGGGGGGSTTNDFFLVM